MWKSELGTARGWSNRLSRQWLEMRMENGADGRLLGRLDLSESKRNNISTRKKITMTEISLVQVCSYTVTSNNLEKTGRRAKVETANTDKYIACRHSSWQSLEWEWHGRLIGSLKYANVCSNFPLLCCSQQVSEM